MHAEEKKLLKENTILHQISRAVEGLKHGPSRATYYWIGGVGALLLFAVLFRYFSRTSESTTSERWVKLDEVLFPEQLKALAAEPDYKDTAQGRLARFKEARLLLTEGLRDLGAGPTEALKKIEKGTEIYEELARELTRSPGQVPLLHQEALWGTAKGLETMGEIEGAKKKYELLVKEYPTSALGKDAANQLTRLDSTEGKKEVSELTKILAPKK